MGCVLSYCRKDNESNVTLLTNNKYCFQCGKMYSPKNYDKHIRKCTKIYERKKNEPKPQ